VNRAVAAVAVAAIALAAGALTVALTARRAAPYPLVCGETFHDARTGQNVPMYYPCSRARP
jgi:hypothetical protein